MRSCSLAHCLTYCSVLPQFVFYWPMQVGITLTRGNLGAGQVPAERSVHPIWCSGRWTPIRARTQGTPQLVRTCSTNLTKTSVVGQGAVAAMASYTESYSLWLMPKGPLADKLQQEIDLLARRFALVPTFAPHVTLLGGIEQPAQQVLQTAAQLAAKLEPYRITFDQISFGKIFHQCVYILCKPEPATMAAGAAAREAYSQDPTSAYMPHLSLLYADISQGEREVLAAEMQERLLEGPGKLEEDGFEVSSLAVWYTPVEDKTLRSWKLVKDFPLQ